MTRPPSSLAGALDGLRILDLTQNLPGPYATLLLAGMGAEVIKVEPPRGETGRSVPAFFSLVNRGKKSIALDLKEATGRNQLLDLVPTCDVVVEGFRPGVMETLALGPETLLPLRPGLVYCRISGFGQSGPYAAHPSHDLNLQALTGVCHMSRDADDHPLGSALPIADLSAGLGASNAIVAALLQQARATGEDKSAGVVIDIALSDVVMGWAHLWGEGLTPSAPSPSAALPDIGRRLRRLPGGLGALVAGRLDALPADVIDAWASKIRRSAPVERLARLRLHGLPHYAVYETKDGRHLAVGIVDEDKFWRALAEALDLQALGGIPLAGRFVLSAPLRSTLRRAFRRQTLATWLDRLPRHQVPVTPVLTVSEAMDDPHLATRVLREVGVPVVPPAFAPGLAESAPRLNAHHDELVGAAT